MRFPKDRDIVYSIKMVEQIKNELLDSIAQLFKSLTSGKEELIAGSLGSILFWVYLLGRRIGISFFRLDCAAEQKARNLLSDGFQNEDLNKDITDFLNYYYIHKSSGRDDFESDTD